VLISFATSAFLGPLFFFLLFVLLFHYCLVLLLLLLMILEPQEDTAFDAFPDFAFLLVYF
jgi:hypothetical protein